MLAVGVLRVDIEGSKVSKSSIIRKVEGHSLFGLIAIRDQNLIKGNGVESEPDVFKISFIGTWLFDLGFEIGHLDVLIVQKVFVRADRVNSDPQFDNRPPLVF